MTPQLNSIGMICVGVIWTCCLFLSRGVGAEVLEAQLLKVGRELRGEKILAPGSKTYVLSSDGLFPYEAVEIRISHLSLPPAQFSFAVSSFPEDGSISIKTRTKKPNLRRRRRLNTAITNYATGKTGTLLLEGIESPRLLLTVTAIPTGVKPMEGPEKQVEVRYNIIMERKVFNNAIPETALRMIGFGVVALFVSAIFLVPALSGIVRRGDELVLQSRDGDSKRHI